FAALVQLVGGMFHEVLCDRVEALLGSPPVPEPGATLARLRRGIVETVWTFALYLVLCLPLFALGFVPIAGQTVAPAMEILLGGFFLALELTRIPMERRGWRLRERLRVLWRRRAESFGFGITLFLLFLVPGMNILALPGAIVGGVLLVRRLSSPA